MNTWLVVATAFVILRDLVNGQITNQKVYVGQSVELKCRPEGLANAAVGIQYRWEKPTGKILVYSQSLILKKVNLKHAGVYTCYAMYMVNGKEKESYASTNLFIQDPNDSNSALAELSNPPLILVNRKDTDMIKHAYGEDLLLKCEVVNWPSEDSYVSWSRDYASEVSSGIKYIKNFKENRQFTCEATNKMTQQRIRRTINVVIDERSKQPLIMSTIVSITTEPASPFHKRDYKLNCNLNPPVQGALFTWMKDDQIIGSGPQYIVRSFKKDDRGKYSCTVDLPSGISTPRNTEVIRADYIRTVGDKVGLTENGVQLVAEEGEYREMHCEIEDKNRYRGSDVTWYKNGQILNQYKMSQDNMGIQNKIYVSILKFKNIIPRNEGDYECRYGPYSSKGVLVVLEKKKDLSIEPKLLEINENQAAEFHCQLYNLSPSLASQMRWSYEPSDSARSLGAVPFTNAENLGFTMDTSSRNSVFLTKTSVNPKDDGFYTCTLPNGMSQKAELRIKPLYRPPTKITVSPKNTVTKPNKEVIIECSADVFDRTNVRLGFRLRGASIPLSDWRFSISSVQRGRIRLTIRPGLTMRESGMELECYNLDGPGSDVARITVMDTCNPGQRKCRSGECLDDSKFCNGYKECLDGSDEDPAVCNQCKPLIKKCEFYNGRQPTKPIYLAHWRCDGENDCGNDFDESACTRENERCEKRLYRCRNGMTIPRAFQCDKDSDCWSNEDESNCVPPSFIRSYQGQEMKRARTGETVTFTCTAVGQPLPIIVWRWNWDCLRDETRMIVISTSSQDCKRQTSVLTITNFQPEDSGIYNCEGLSGNSRAFSEDYRLIRY